MVTNSQPFTTSSSTALRRFSNEGTLGGLSALVRGIQQHLDSDTTLYADLPGMWASDNPISTLPAIILVTSAHPDMVLVEEDKVTLIELTFPQNSMESLSNARKCKSEKVSYLQALSDLEVKGIVSNLYTIIEIGSLGHWLHAS